MPAKVWSLSHLSQEEERLLKQAEATMGGKLLLAYEPGQVEPAQLDTKELQSLQELEQRLGMSVVAVAPRS